MRLRSLFAVLVPFLFVAAAIAPQTARAAVATTTDPAPGWVGERVVNPATDDWEPAVALDSKGVAWIAWDGYARGNYDVFLRSLDGSQPGPVITVTTEPAGECWTAFTIRL